MLYRIDKNKGFSQVLEERDLYATDNDILDHNYSKIREGGNWAFIYTDSWFRETSQLSYSEQRLLLYMVCKTNKKPIKVNSEGKIIDWANLGFYFDSGFLCFARNASYIANDLGYKNSGSINNQLVKLHQKGFIRRMGWDVLKLRNKEVQQITIWATGELIKDKDDIPKMYFYYELSQNDRIEKMKQGEGILEGRGVKFYDYCSMSEYFNG